MQLELDMGSISLDSQSMICPQSYETQTKLIFLLLSKDMLKYLLKYGALALLLLFCSMLFGAPNLRCDIKTANCVLMLMPSPQWQDSGLATKRDPEARLKR